VSQTFDALEFRTALGAFATGVTLVTTRNAAGEPVGLTANSFNSVSLQPPLVLWSLARNSNNLAAFSQAQHWAVHILASDQEALSKRFATRGVQKFEGLEIDSGVGEVPLLRGCTARFQCRTAFQYDGGDHIIFVGEVRAFDHFTSPPLLFHGGRYAMALERESLHAPRDVRLAGDVIDEFFSYLLGRGHSLFQKRIRPMQRTDGIGDDEHLVLALLLMHDGLTAAEVESTVGQRLSGGVAKVLETLEARRYVHRTLNKGDEAGYSLSDAGRDRGLRLVAAAKAYEAEISERLGPKDSAVLKSLLRKLLAVANE
jgi:3-hydroxy-9,10-secoandrosta-1,3,5(10)-triene-9,17-dione monooxygenase reductase component